MNPEEQEIRATFDDYAVEFGGNDGWASTPMMPLYSLQEALIRVFNVFISQELIDAAALDSGEIEMSMEEITLHEFRGIYRSVKALLDGSKGAVSEGIAEDNGSTGGESISTMGSRLSANALSKEPTRVGRDQNDLSQSKLAPMMLNLSGLQQPFDDQDDIVAGSGMNVVRKKMRQPANE